MEHRPHRLETGWRPNRALVLASLSVAGTAAIGCLLFAVPRDFPGWWGLAPEGADRFAQVLGPIANVEPLRSSSFAFMFRLLLLVACVSWLGAIVLAFRGACPPKRPTMALVVAGSLLLAFLAPPVLSRDVFGYVAYHRVPFRYGLNPYIHGRSTLEQVGDPSAAFIVWDTPLPYGPLWPLATVGFGWAAVGGLYGEVVAHKLFAALALVTAALIGARLAETRERGRGLVSLLALGVNPFLLLEGPATGHNDLVMLAPLIGAAALTATGRWRAGALALGMSAAIKPVTFTAVPLLVFERVIRRPHSRRWQDVAWMAGLAAAPTLLGSAAFGGPGVLVRSVLSRTQASQSDLLATLFPVAIIGASVIGLGMIYREREGLPAAWLAAWIPVAAVLILFGSLTRFPWYLSWMLVPALTGWDERHRLAIAATVTLSLLATWQYVATP